MTKCFVCKSNLQIERLKCTHCNTVFEGGFSFPLLAKLSLNSQKLALELILAGGNLKDLAEKLGITYPTLKKRIQDLQSELIMLIKERDDEITYIKSKIRNNEISKEEGEKIINELLGNI
ncbi:conserved hypothetical protein [Nautilia profundicola AmH]|uniref:DUF2089 domain-containing protein n=1 Tax=Nautilia profundicola (strain ATCC BAA-1463 / DSM 18972 / AmH) TaxID=598659 RepID=B9L9M9_NAUPA|nr:DUF2089 family protein [Nautilia profundicola]ACM92930.1 conserved hypothetical protein [Nautilia profundicola AmH]